MKAYLLSVCYPEGATPPSPEALEKIGRDVTAVNEEMRVKGAWVFAGGLCAASTATVVQFKDDELLMTDGPFAEGKEYLGGICVIHANDLDAALNWGRKLARAIPGVGIEVRPFMDQPS